jgi:hypothetical protein
MESNSTFPSFLAPAMQWLRYPHGTPKGERPCFDEASITHMTPRPGHRVRFGRIMRDGLDCSIGVMDFYTAHPCFVLRFST